MYRSLNEYLKESFGGKVYKIALSTGFSCPNRDGSNGWGGCAFCSGAGEFAESGPIPEQLARAKARVAAKLKGAKNPRYIAYFQSFSNTYGPLEAQEEMFSQALSDPQVAVLSVATRPDCLPEEVLDLLDRLNQIKPVWVELGLQTAREETARRLNRRFSNGEFVLAVQALARRGIRVVVHLILGLPGETHEDEIETARFVSALPVFGVKIHLLHVVKGTRLAETDYIPLTLEEYGDRASDLLRYLRPDIVIHRLTGDGDKRTLLAPFWSGDKKRVLNALKAKTDAVTQGEALEEKQGRKRNF